MDEFYRQINERIRRIERERLRIIERTNGDLGIMTSEHYLLMQLSKFERITSQAQVADMLHVSPARVTLVLKNLVAEGYIERSSGADGRRNEITITEKGNAMVKRSREFFRQLNVNIYEVFSREELDQLFEYLNRLLERLLEIQEEETGRNDG